MSNPEVIDPHGIGSTLTSPSTDPAVASEPGYVDPADAAKAEATKAEADTKAQGQNKRCSNGKCGTEVPGQCCEWMSKFNIATQRAMRPYSNSCGSCNGSGEKGGGPCQACDGTGIEGSTGGGFNQSVTLVRLEYITTLEQLEVYSQKCGSVTIEKMLRDSGTVFDAQWKFHFIPHISKVYVSVSLDTLNSCYKTNGCVAIIIRYRANNQDSLVYKKSNIMPIYIYNNIYYAIQGDLREEFPEEDF